MTVIATLEFQNAITSRSRAGHTQGAHHGFGTGRNKPQHLDPGQTRCDPFRQLKRVRLARAETPGRIDRFAHNLGHVRITMAKHQRPEALTEIDVFTAIDRLKFRARCATKEDWSTTDTLECAHRTVDAARCYALRAFEIFEREVSNCVSSHESNWSVPSA